MDDDTVIYAGVEAIRSTALAVQCLVDSREIWIPRSQIGDDSEVQDSGDCGELIVTEWFARKEGLPPGVCEHGHTNWHFLADETWCYGPFRYES